MTKIKALIILILVGLAAIFVVQNVSTVVVKSLFFSLSIPGSLLMVGLIALGFLLGLTVSSLSRLKGD